MPTDTPCLDAAGLQRFNALRQAAVEAVTQRMCARQVFGGMSATPAARDACREDLGFHLEFLRPVLEFGLIQPMVDYLRWLASVLATRGVPAAHLPESLDGFAEFFTGRMAVSDSRIVAAALQRAKAGLLEPGARAPGIYDMMPAPWPECGEFEAALLAGNRRGAATLFEGRIADGDTLVEAELHLIQPALYEIGRKWQENQVTVAQEHLATAISQSLMMQGLLAAPVQASNGGRVLLACVAGNTHSVGLQMVADAFQVAGWDAQYLGASVPTRDLVEHVGRSRPDLLALSVSFAQQLRVVREVIAELTRVHGDARPPVIIGGLAINQFNRLAQELGADAWSPDARAAVASGAGLAQGVLHT